MNSAKTLTRRGMSSVADPVTGAQHAVAPLSIRVILWLNYLPFHAAMYFNNFLCRVLKPIYFVVKRLYKIAFDADWQNHFSPKDDRVWELLYPREAMATFEGIKPYDRTTDAFTVRHAARAVVGATVRIAALIALMLWLGVL